jgi:uncharacterized protein YeaO (DUF488 family)
MPVKTGCASKSGFHKKNSRPANSGTVILITVGRPFPWVDYDDWKQVLGPRAETKTRWLASNKTEADKKIYLDDFLPKMKRPEEVKEIEGLGQRVKKGKTITLLCYCKPGDFCHRDIIKSLIENHNYRQYQGT